MVDWVVSHSDVESHPSYSVDENGKVPLLDIILSDFGMATNIGYYTDNRHLEAGVPPDWPEDEPHFGYTHRSPFTGKVVGGPRYVGQARSDGKWRRFVSDFLDLPIA